MTGVFRLFRFGARLFRLLQRPVTARQGQESRRAKQGEGRDGIRWTDVGVSWAFQLFLPCVFAQDLGV